MEAYTVEDAAKGKIAISLQKLKRGGSARNQAKILKFERYMIAAFIIQRAYRRWKEMRAFSRRLRRRAHRRKLKEAKKARKLAAIRSDMDVGGSKAMQQRDYAMLKRLMRGKGNFEEKTLFWRRCIELRRAHGPYNTEIMIKAIIAAKGDLQRSLVLIGNEEFALRQTDDMDYQVKRFLLPLENVILEEHQMGGKKNGGKGMGSKADTLSQSILADEETWAANNALDVVRALKIREEIKQREEEEKRKKASRSDYCKDGLDLSMVIQKAFYSKHYEGCHQLPPKIRYIEPGDHSPNFKRSHAHSSRPFHNHNHFAEALQDPHHYDTFNAKNWQDALRGSIGSTSSHVHHVDNMNLHTPHHLPPRPLNHNHNHNHNHHHQQQQQQHMTSNESDARQQESRHDNRNEGITSYATQDQNNSPDSGFNAFPESSSATSSPDDLVNGMRAAAIGGGFDHLYRDLAATPEGVSAWPSMNRHGQELDMDNADADVDVDAFMTSHALQNIQTLQQSEMDLLEAHGNNNNNNNNNFGDRPGTFDPDGENNSEDDYMSGRDKGKDLFVETIDMRDIDKDDEYMMSNAY